MRVGVFKRSVSFVLDAIPIVLIATALFSLFIGDLIKPDNYDTVYDEYQTIRGEYFDDLEEQYRNEEITLDQYQTEYDLIIDDFNTDTADHILVIYTYFIYVIVYHVLSFIVIYFIYVVLTKGRTLGRRLMKIQLAGNLTVWRLFLREVLWKGGYWIITFGIGGLLLDIAMISFSKRKMTLRDLVSGIYVTYEGVEYPF